MEREWRFSPRTSSKDQRRRLPAPARPNPRAFRGLVLDTARSIEPATGRATPTISPACCENSQLWVLPPTSSGDPGRRSLLGARIPATDDVYRTGSQSQARIVACFKSFAWRSMMAVRSPHAALCSHLSNFGRRDCDGGVRCVAALGGLWLRRRSGFDVLALHVDRRQTRDERKEIDANPV